MRVFNTISLLCGVVRCFKRSVETLKLRDENFIGDGDSKVYLEVVKADTYDGFAVKKCECVGHIQKRECVGHIQKRECVGHIQKRECVGHIQKRECVGHPKTCWVSFKKTKEGLL